MSANPELPTIHPVQLQETVEALWSISYQPAGCPRCRQAFLVDASRLGQTCPNCWQGQLASQPALLRNEPPELVIPFQTANTDLPQILTGFVKGVWLPTNDFNPASLAQRAVPVFIPMWLVDSDLCGEWQAEVGFDYQVKSSRESYKDTGWQSQDVLETRIRWEPRLGDLNRHYDNIAVPALSDHEILFKWLGDYRYAQSMAYSSEAIKGMDVHVPDLQPENAWPKAQNRLNQVAESDCLKASNAQHVRNYSLNAGYNSLNWSQLLLPAYLTYYTDDDGKPHTVFINAQTGHAGGLRMASQKKGWMYAGISAGIAAALFILGLLSLGFVFALPSLSTIGALFLVMAFIFLVLAIIPATWPWQWNRRQQEQKVHLASNKR